MRTCQKCGIAKAATEFHMKDARTQRRRTDCRACVALYGRAYYLAHLEYYSAKRRINNRNSVRRNRGFVLEYLIAHPCVDCGEADPRVLEFDHVRGVKRGAIAELIHD